VHAFTAEAKKRALALGFARVGVARAERLEPEATQLRAFLDAGRHGAMSWLEDTAEVRADPRHPGMVEGAVSVLVVAMPYARRRADDAPIRVARYAHGRDYHNVLGKKLRKLVRWLREEGHDARFSVDSRPVLERAWAERAGLGFVGKNCCLIVPGLGSHVFLGTVVTTAELEPDAPIARRCGSCRLCLDACPTDAFARARELDARRCISYLTIETRGAIPESLEARHDGWLFGCDACQDVCPYNRGALPEGLETSAFAGRELPAAEALLTMDATRFETLTAGSPLRRPGLDALARNAAIALGNRGAPRHLPALRQAAGSHPSPIVRAAAARAALRLAKQLGVPAADEGGMLDPEALRALLVETLHESSDARGLLALLRFLDWLEA